MLLVVKSAIVINEYKKSYFQENAAVPGCLNGPEDTELKTVFPEKGGIIGQG